MRGDNVDTRARARFGMPEREYLLDRISMGWSAGQIADEIGFSRVAVRARLMKLAERGKPWVAREEAA